MDIKNLTVFSCGLLLVIPVIDKNHAFAGENTVRATTNPISVYENDWAYHASGKIAPFEKIPNKPKTGSARDTVELVEEPKKRKANKDTKKIKFLAEKSMEEQILDKIPLGKNFKYVWNVADGDEDIFMEGLRADRSNRGLTYRFSEMPVIGSVSGMTFKISAGKENEIAFKTHTIPFMGELEGYTLKGSTNNKDGSKIFARYTVPLDF